MHISFRRMLTAIGCLVFALPLFSRQPLPLSIHVTLSPQQWTSIPLPARTIALTRHGDEIWACGEHELIAVSSDGGSTWKLRHLAKSDKLLLTMTFAAAQTGYAFGSDGLELRSTDGGATWKHYSKTPGMVLYAQFSDRTHGLVTSTKWYATTRDGGRTWRGNTAIDDVITRTRVDLRIEVWSAAVIDARHAVVLLAPIHDTHGQLLNYTRDGGKTWKSVRFPTGMYLGALGRAGHEYQAYGCQTVGTGHDCRPVRLISTDGVNWKRVLQATPQLQACAEQGCLDGGDRAVLWGRDGELQFPLRPLRVFDWAAGAGGICLVNSQLRCTVSRTLSVAETASSHLAAPTLQVDKKTTCLSCTVPYYPVRDDNEQGMVTVVGWVSKQGVPEDLWVLSAPSQHSAKIALAAVRTWRLAPAKFHHRPVREPFYVQLDMLGGVYDRE